MVGYRIPKTLIKVGNFVGDLEEKIKKFNKSFIKLPGPIANLKENYCLYNSIQEPYLIIISKLSHSKYEYNIAINSASYSQEKNKEIVIDFRTKTGIELRDHNKKIEKVDYIANLFQLFEEEGEKRTMIYLKNICVFGSEIIKRMNKLPF